MTLVPGVPDPLVPWYWEYWAARSGEPASSVSRFHSTKILKILGTEVVGMVVVGGFWAAAGVGRSGGGGVWERGEEVS